MDQTRYSSRLTIITQNYHTHYKRLQLLRTWSLYTGTGLVGWMIFRPSGKLIALILTVAIAVANLWLMRWDATWLENWSREDRAERELIRLGIARDDEAARESMERVVEAMRKFDVELRVEELVRRIAQEKKPKGGMWN